MECLGCKVTPLLFGDLEYCRLVYQLAGVELEEWKLDLSWALQSLMNK